jgi:hypothetical protein
MKLKEGFLLREVAGQTVVLPTGGNLDLDMMITLNETGKFLWERLQEETNVQTLVDALLAEYDVDRPRAEQSVEAFVEKLKNNGLLCE